MAEEKIYCGSGKKRKDFAREVTICLEDYPKEYINEYKGKHYLKLNVVDKREPDQYGKDIFVTVNTWKPDSQHNGRQESPSEPEVDESPLPF